MTITTTTLSKHGFFATGQPNIYALRVHELIHLEYDLNDGFVSIKRFFEFGTKYNKDHVCITFPHKVDTQQKLKNLVNLFKGNW
jgi:hypothetical protein